MSIYTSISGINANQNAVNNTSNNIANMQTNGYKRIATQFTEEINGGVSTSSTQDTYQGSINITNNKLDLAIAGDGYFSVKNNNGDTFYTRNGNFSLNKDGYVVDNNGYQLQNTNNQSIQISNINDITIDKNGVISNGDKIAVSSFNSALQPVGNNLYKTNQTPNNNTDYDIISGANETSNVNPAEELVNLIKQQRNLEFNVQAVQIDSSIFNSLIDIYRKKED